MKSVRIGNGCGFFGDNLDAPVLLAQQGNLHYLTLEYLAELTMSILAVQKQKNPEAGFASDFADVFQRLLPVLNEQPRLRIITNAGGMNPDALATRIFRYIDRSRISRKIALVDGDDLLPRLDQLLSQGHGFVNVDTGEPLEIIRDRVVSANAYLGSGPIVDALQQGADIIITGRVADASLTVAPAIHEFGWKFDDWDRLASATVAGHLIECGAQVTGGLWCNWPDASDLANVGYPIADFNEDGSFVITKPENTGGTVNRETVSEQLLYEVGDPARYLTPDVVADFTSIQLTGDGPDRVHVSPARGLPAPDSYKVSIAYRAGYSCSGMLALQGPDAPAKAILAGNMILDRLKRIGVDVEHKNIEVLGTGACTPGVIVPATEPVEVVLRVSVRDSFRPVVERFAKEFAPLVTSGPPGVTGYTTGRPRVREVFAYWPALLNKNAIIPRVRILP